MVGLVDYGSGSESDSDTPVFKQQEPKPQAKRPTKKKIGISLPALSSKRGDDDVEDSIDDRPAKKPRTTGSGRSSLFGMLPVPKQTTPITVPKERVLGGGSGLGLVFKTSRTGEEAPSTQEPFSNPYTTTTSEENEVPPEPSSSKPFLLPPSLKKGRVNVSLEETSANTPKPIVSAPLPGAPAVDFFSLGSTKSATPAIHSSSSSLSSAPIPSISSAPVLPDFKIPEPTPYDPYPGYYQLPSGVWAAHDPEYFAKFSKKWHDDYNAHVRALEKGTAKGFEGYNDSSAQQIDPIKEMERAKKEIHELEERKALTIGAGAGPSEPKMKITAAKMSGVARSRHQLGTMLKEAYENREILEERIAAGKRNRKEAGNKYGF